MFSFSRFLFGRRLKRIGRAFLSSGSAGFTLIELTVVLFLLGILVVVVVPNIDSFLYRGDLKSAARSFKATVRFLRSKSTVTGKYTALCLDLEHGTFWGEYDEPDPEDEIFTLTPKKYLPLTPALELPQGIRFLDAATIRFPKTKTGQLRALLNPKGVIEETVIHLADSRNRVLTIIINAYTGRFSLYEEYVDVEYKPIFPISTD